MLNSIDLNDKTYDELLMEAVAQIPLYSKEWTNYNVSDPGITILQNLTAFQLLQQESVNDVSEQVRLKLLQLVGYSAKENKAAKVLVQAPVQGGDILPMGHRLWSGNTAFETAQETMLQPWGLAAVYAYNGDIYRDLTRMLAVNTETFAFPFGRRPERGNALVCVLSGTPEMGEPVRLWLQVAEEELRTPFDDEAEIPAFSRVRWQYFANGGWQDTRFEDETIGLLRSGAVTLWLEGDIPDVFTETAVEGCAFRCLLETADYDRTPRLKALSVHLFEVTQTMTRVQCFTFAGSERAVLRGYLPSIGNYHVFCKESQNDGYRLYRKALTKGQNGRLYSEEGISNGTVVTIDAETGYAPCDSDDAVRIVCFDDEMIHHRLLGPVYGYDNQIVQLEMVENVIDDRFLLALEDRDANGEAKYFFAAPGEKLADGFCYHLRGDKAQIVIDDPGKGGYQLILAGCVSTEGELGNLREGAILEQRGGYDGTEVEATYFCPAPGRGGVSHENAEQLRRRFSGRMQQMATAVRAEDYEFLVKQTPGLCIHKVKAVAFGTQNLVKIAVKPYTEEELPKLSKEYLSRIGAFLEPRRMLTTRFEICQPRYVPIGVRATLNIRGMASYAKEEAERLLRETIDHVNGPHDFGEWVRFNDIYQRLNALPFVETIDDLKLFPESRDASMVGNDIQLDDNSLCYPGTVSLVIREHGR